MFKHKPISSQFLDAFDLNQYDIDYSRRRFVTGVVTGSAMLGLGFTNQSAFAMNNTDVIHSGPTVLRGIQFNLNYSETPVNLTGKDRIATAINGAIPAPILGFKEGDAVTLNVTNNMAVDTSIHWHGLILPSAQDGVPNISDGFKGIKPGATFRYQFPIKQSGTYWYHNDVQLVLGIRSWF